MKAESATAGTRSAQSATRVVDRSASSVRAPLRRINTLVSIHELSSRPFARLLFVAAAAGLVGVTIDLVRAPPATALPALAPLSIDHSMANDLIDDDVLDPGASVAAYDTSFDKAGVKAPAPTLKAPIADDMLEPGASVAAYGS